MATKRASHSRKKSSEKEDKDGAPRGRSLWTGTLGFGLVQIPVRMMTAESHEDISFHQLDKHDMSRIRYERVNESTGKPVAWKDIVKGYELDDGRYVVVEEEDFEKANVKASHAIDISDFVARAQIPPTYFETPYVLVPDRGAGKAYAVLREAMAKKDYVAIGLVVIRTRQHLCAIFPYEGALLLELLRFEEDLKPLADHAPSVPTPTTKKESELAELLIESLVSDWDPSKYKDTYRHELLAAIQHKAKTGKMPAAGKHAAPKSNVTDLVALLQKSVKSAGKSKRKHKAA